MGEISTESEEDKALTEIKEIFFFFFYAKTVKLKEMS